jgi:hypothetical protein
MKSSWFFSYPSNEDFSSLALKHKRMKVKCDFLLPLLLARVGVRVSKKIFPFPGVPVSLTRTLSF